MKKSAIIFWCGIVALFLLGGPFFVQNILWFFTEESITYLLQGRWDWVVFYIAIFSVFSFFILSNPLKKGRWRGSSNAYIAFIIALFAEMFGFPLSIYLLSQYISLPAEQRTPAVAFNFEFFGIKFSLLSTSFIAGIVSIFGMLLIMVGWKEIYRSKNELVTDGIYGFIRHPQYLGIILITTVWLFAWPTLITAIMWPILLFSYYRLAKKEENEMEKQFGEKYLEYKKRVPMLLPHLRNATTPFLKNNTR